MPVHDWTRVPAGIFHSLHNAWITHLTESLKAVLPRGYYALAEQKAGGFGPDVLALGRRGMVDDEDAARSSGGVPLDEVGGVVALAAAPPRLSISLSTDEAADYARRQRVVAVRHVTGDELVALIEIASPGNKDRPSSVRAFARKAAAVTAAGCHLVVIDPFPPGTSDPHGLCSMAFAEMGGPAFWLPADKSRSVAAYRATEVVVDCYAEPLAVGNVWPDVPLFFSTSRYVNVPLEETYTAAFAGVPEHLQDFVSVTST